jgi:hypothetical protein
MMVQEYGMVIGQADPSFFDFNIVDRSYRPIAYEYVEVEVEEPQADGAMRKLQVLGQVKQITSSHPFYDQRTTPGAAWKQRELGVGEEMIQIIATVKILGYLHEEGGRNEVRRPRSPPMPGTPVYRASDELLQRLFSLDERELPLDVGHLLHRESISVPISGKELHRHTAILAMTRYGKSYFAGRIMEQLLRQGASLLVIDAHGDYANMVQDPEGHLHAEFWDKVTVFRPAAAEGFEGNHVKSLQLSISACSQNELCALAGIDGSLQKIRLRNAMKKVRAKNKFFTLDDLIAELEESLEEAEEGEEDQAEGKGKKKVSTQEKTRIAGVIDRLKDLNDREIFTEGDINVAEFFKPMALSDIFLSGLQDSVQDVLVGMILRRVFYAKYRREPWARLPIFVFVEEAHRFAAPPDEGGGKFSRDILARIAAEGAKFGVFLTVISQRPRRIDPDILSNCSNLAILRVVNSQDQRTIQAASESFSEDLLGDLPALEQGEAVLVGPFVPVPVMIRTAERETKHGGRTPDIYRLLKDARDQAEIQRERDKEKLH